MIQLSSLDTSHPNVKAQMLAILGEVWSFVDYFHPDANSRLNWKQPLFDAYGLLSQDFGRENFVRALRLMLSQLNDPSTQLFLDDELLFSPLTLNILETPPGIQRMSDGTPVLMFGSGACFKRERDKAVAHFNGLAEQILADEKIVVDLRGASTVEDGTFLANAFDDSLLARTFTSGSISAPRQTWQFYYGLPPSSGRSSGGYRIWPTSLEGTVFRPIPNAHTKRAVFIADRFSPVPSLVVACQFAGSGYIIGDGSIRGFVGFRKETLIISGLGEIDVRLADLGTNLTAGGFRANETLDSTLSNSLMQRALDLLNETSPFQSVYELKGKGTLKRGTSKQIFPAVGQRILAAAKIWGTFSFFFPYNDLMEKSWNELLVENILEFESCTNELDYALAISKLVAHANDSHVYVSARQLESVFWSSQPPFACRMISEKAVVSKLTDEGVQAGLKVGDVILSVDGISVDKILEERRPYFSASTKHGGDLILLTSCFSGADNSKMSLKIWRDGRERELIEVVRSNKNRSLLENQHYSGKPYRLLSEELGYANLPNLPPQQVNAMFEHFKNTKGIIFDGRGYPQGTAWIIAPRLIGNEHNRKARSARSFALTDVPAAKFSCPTNPLEPGSTAQNFRHIVQCLPYCGDWLYAGRTVLLIDESAISQAEHTGLFMRAANGTTFIGTPTCGADGDVTNFSLPGLINVGMTGQAVTYPDGTQLQRKGLTPDIYVSPTVEGIAAGRDEILERAIEFLNCTSSTQAGW